MRGGLSRSSGEGVRSEAVIVSGVPRGKGFHRRGVGLEYHLSHGSLGRPVAVVVGLRTAGDGLPYRRGRLCGLALGRRGSGWPKLCPLTVVQKWGSRVQLERGMGRLGTSPAWTVKVPFEVCTVMRFAGYVSVWPRYSGEHLLSSIVCVCVCV